MTKLFLLKPDFKDPNLDRGERNYFCPHCAVIEGLLSYYPKLTEQMEVEYVEFQRPRQSIIDLIGEENQSCPVLVTDKIENHKDLQKAGSGLFFINETEQIVAYLTANFGIGNRHP